MAVEGSSASGSDWFTDVVVAFRRLHAVTLEIDVAACNPHELRALTDGIRDGQQALDEMLMLVGVAADLHQD